MKCRRDRKRFDQHERGFTCEVLVVAFKKSQDFLAFFQDFISTFQTFSRIKDCANPADDLCLAIAFRQWEAKHSSLLVGTVNSL